MDHLCLHLCLCSFFIAAQSRAGAKQSAGVLSKERKVCIYWYFGIFTINHFEVLRFLTISISYLVASFGEFYFLNISITVVLIYSLQLTRILFTFVMTRMSLLPCPRVRCSCWFHRERMFPVMPQILCVSLRNILRLHILAQKSIRVRATAGCFIVKNKQRISCFQGCLH